MDSGAGVSELDAQVCKAFAGTCGLSIKKQTFAVSFVEFVEFLLQQRLDGRSAGGAVVPASQQFGNRIPAFADSQEYRVFRGERFGEATGNPAKPCRLLSVTVAQ